jgi:VanZ family protein
MTSLVAPIRSAQLTFLAAVAGVIGVSVAAYAGLTPPALSSHGVDKVLHATMAAVLTFCLARAMKGRAALAAILVMIPVGIDEYLQRFSHRRSSDWGDLAADVVGALLVVAIYTLRRRAASWGKNIARGSRHEHLAAPARPLRTRLLLRVRTGRTAHAVAAGRDDVRDRSAAGASLAAARDGRRGDRSRRRRSERDTG